MPKKSDQWRPRLSIDITIDQHQKLQKLFPWGVQQAFWRAIVDDVIDILERKGELAIAVILDKALRFKEISKVLQELEDLPDVHPQGSGPKINLGTHDGGTSRTPTTDPPLSSGAKGFHKETTGEEG